MICAGRAGTCSCSHGPGGRGLRTVLPTSTTIRGRVLGGFLLLVLCMAPPLLPTHAIITPTFAPRATLAQCFSTRVSDPKVVWRNM